MAEKSAVKKHKKALPTWVLVVVIVAMLAVIGVVYARIQSQPPRPEDRDPNYNLEKAKFFKKLQNPSNTTKILSAAKRAQLAKEDRIPEAWAATPPDYSVPWETAKNTEEVRQFIEKYDEKK